MYLTTKLAITLGIKPLILNHTKKKNSGAIKARNAVSKLTRKQRVVSWSNIEDINSFYKICPEGYHVDHILPLNGRLVSGLHVLENLQYLPAKDNLAKSNKYLPE